MTIAIIGTGNMGGAIANGLIKSSYCLPENIICTAKTDTTLKKLQNSFPKIQVTNNNANAIKNADVIILAVKPWLIGDIIEEIRPALNLNKQIIVSLAAGITLQELSNMIIPENGINNKEKLFASEERMNNETDKFAKPTLFKIVPNTAVEILEGVTFISQQNATDEQTNLIYEMFATLGYAVVVDEKLIPAATALSSCGIAFAMRYIRAATEGGVELGFRPDEAARIVEHTVKGAASLLLQNNRHPEVEIDKVTTAGGITIKGLNAMEESGFSAAVINGLKASK